MGVHHALGVARGARGEKHRRHVISVAGVDFLLHPTRVRGHMGGPRAHARVQRGQAAFLVIAQAAWVVIDDVRNARTLAADFDHLVDLLLVFHHRKTHLGVVDGEHIFGRHRVLVQGHRNGAQGLGRQHGDGQARAVGTHHHDVLPTAQAGQMQACSHLRGHLRHIGPTVAVPNAIFFFAHGRGLRSLLGLAHQQLRKRALHLVPNVSCPACVRAVPVPAPLVVRRWGFVSCVTVKETLTLFCRYDDNLGKALSPTDPLLT